MKTLDIENLVIEQYGLDAMLKSETELNFRFTVCVSDAPYHRTADFVKSINIEFKNMSELNTKLNEVKQDSDIELISSLLEETF